MHCDEGIPLVVLEREEREEMTEGVRLRLLLLPADSDMFRRSGTLNRVASAFDATSL